MATITSAFRVDGERSLSLFLAWLFGLLLLVPILIFIVILVVETAWLTINGWLRRAYS